MSEEFKTDDERFMAALAHIQEAQHHANAAARALCSLNQGFRPDSAYSIACKLGDHIKAEWHRVNNQRIEAMEMNGNQSVTPQVRCDRPRSRGDR